MTRKIEIVKIDTSNNHQVRRFLDLPFRLYRDICQWVPPLSPGARRMLDRRKHPFHQQGQAEILWALDDLGRVIGRLAVLENKNYNPLYYPEMITALGFKSKRDMVSGYHSANMNFPENIHQLSERIQHRRNLKVTRFKSRAELRAIAPRLKVLNNHAQAGINENPPLTDRDDKSLINDLENTVREHFTTHGRSFITKSQGVVIGIKP